MLITDSQAPTSKFKYILHLDKNLFLLVTEHGIYVTAKLVIRRIEMGHFLSSTEQNIKVTLSVRFIRVEQFIKSLAY